MRWQILNLAEIDACPGVLDSLISVADLHTLAPTGKNLLEKLPEADAYFASLKTPVDAALLAQCPRLRLIATPSTGHDHLDVKAAKAQGIEILSLRGETVFLNSVTATAELAWGLLLAAVRKLPAACAAANEGIWARDRFRGHQLSGKTLGILGFGRLGRMMADYAHAFRMPVIACEHTTDPLADGVRRVDFDTLLRESDVLSIHVHLTEENRNLIDREAIKKMKPGAVLINTSRGAIVDEAALVDSLEGGHLLAAGVDVIDGEWDSDLYNHTIVAYARTHENLIITPHIGGVTLQSQRAGYQFIAEKLRQRICELDSAAGYNG